MKKTIYFILCLVIVVISSCTDELSTKVDNSYGSEITWKLPDYALGVLNNAYSNISAQPDGWSSDFLDVATDNALSNNRSSNLYAYGQGAITPISNPFDNWNTTYNVFQYIHLFMEKGLGGTVIFNIADSVQNKAIRSRSLGECYFLRAYWGMELLKRFGGITKDGQALGYPIVTKSLSVADLKNTAQLPRNTYEECAMQIIADCDSAIKYLPSTYVGSDGNVGLTQNGRASGAAAFVLKSRVALFAASPAYQPTGSFAISTDSINKKWFRAALYSQQAITKVGSFTALTAAMLVGSGVQSVTDPEILFRKWFNNNYMEKSNFPPLFFGQGRTNPSQNLVDAYPAKNGYPISDSRSGYNPQNPYINRDNRFELTIFYNQKVFSTQRPLEIYSFVVNDTIHKGRDVSGYDYQNSVTGYYLCKFMSSKKNMLYDPATLGSTNDYHLNPLIRRAEAYYNLAEASNELVGPTAIAPGCTLSAYAIIKDIRTKNGITSTAYLDEVAAQGTAAFRTLILNERRLEFAFENQRFFDLRRQKLPLNEAIRGVSVVKNGTTFQYQGTDPNSAGLIIENRNLSDQKYYYLPIPYNEMMNDKNLVQNIGW